MKIADAKRASRNPQCFSEIDAFIIVNGDTNEPIQSSFDKEAAARHVRWLNDHESRCGRSTVYKAIEVTK